MPLARTIAMLLLIAAGCDRGSTGPSTTSGESGPTHLTVEVTPITPLLPRLPTHLAIDSHANLYWQQESPDAANSSTGDLVFVMGNSGVPQALPGLTVPNLLAAAGQPGGRGAIRSMAVGPGDNLFVLFTGGKGRSPLAFIAMYTPSTRAVKVIADTARLMAATEMGPSLELARGSLVSYGADLWLWYRHTDAGALLRIVESRSGAGGFEFRAIRLKSTDPKHPLRLLGEGEDLSAGPDQNLHYADRPRAALWKISGEGRGLHRAIDRGAFRPAFRPRRRQRGQSLPAGRRRRQTLQPRKRRGQLRVGPALLSRVYKTRDRSQSGHYSARIFRRSAEPVDSEFAAAHPAIRSHERDVYRVRRGLWRIAAVEYREEVASFEVSEGDSPQRAQRAQRGEMRISDFKSQMGNQSPMLRL